LPGFQEVAETIQQLGYDAFVGCSSSFDKRRTLWTEHILIGSLFSQAFVTPLSQRGEGLFPNKYGHFDPESREFVFTNVLTPRPWINVLANEQYGIVVSQAGSGFSWLDNCQLFRLSRWEQDLVTDAYGRYVYIADQSCPERLWSTTYMPTQVKAEHEEVRHGLGTTVFHRFVEEIESVQTLFVPPNLPLEISIVSLTNHSELERNLQLGTYLEWHLGGQGDWHREFHRLFVSTQIEGDTMLAWKRPGLEENVREPSKAGPTAFVRIIGAFGIDWFSDKAQWMGRLGQVHEPLAMKEAVQPISSGRWDDPIAAGRFNVSLKPGETKAIAVVIGATVGLDSALGLARSITLEGAHSLLEETRTFHRESSEVLEIQTPDPIVDLMANAWLPYQATIGRMTARCAYYQQGGAYGFRDQLQDSLMHLDTDPSITLRQIGIHAEAMYDDGSVRHWWHPNSSIFTKSKHSDTCLWLSHATLDYLDETADLSTLDLEFRYVSDGDAVTTGSLLEHCQKGVDRALERRSARGLPLIGAGDWNDGLSHAGLDGKGESAWLAMFLFQILNRMALVFDRIGLVGQAERYRAEAVSLQQAVESHAWDGEWYIAGTDDEGRPFGSNQCKEGRIFLNPQTWAVISGIASPDRAKQAMASVQKYLIKPYGALLLAPAFSEVDPYIGYITRYAPGLRENGGVYSHAATWAVQALAMSGDAESAYALWRGMCPPFRAAEDADLYSAEPYVMPGNTDGPDSPFESRAGWTWYTGSAAWMRRVLVHWILGVRPSLDGLLVETKLPLALPGFAMTRPFRGDVFQFELANNERKRETFVSTGSGTVHSI